MKNLDMRLFGGERLFEYLLLIPIDETVSSSVKAIKETFMHEFGCEQAGRHPHISLIQFMQYEGAEFRITNCFDKFAQFVKPPQVDLSGFGQFPNHTIYINIASAAAIQNIVRQMRQRFQKLLKPNTSLQPRFIDQPHLTIARGMDEEQFQRAWKEWSGARFEDTYTAKEMLLIKRQVDPKTLTPIGFYRPVKHFPFRGKPKSEQLSLTYPISPVQDDVNF